MPNQSEPSVVPFTWHYSVKHLLLATVWASALLAIYAQFGWRLAGCFLSLSLIVVGLKRLPLWPAQLVTGSLLLVFCLIADDRPRGPHRLATCLNNLHQLALALIIYEARHGSFPPAYIADQNGVPMHSWRVLILPYLGRQDLFDKYRFDEPWNGPNNRKLAASAPEIFRCPSDAGAGPMTTSYVAVVGSTTAWPGSIGSKSAEFQDGITTTVLLVEAKESGIHWMEPRDLEIDQMPTSINPTAAIGISSNHPGGANVAFANRATRFVSNEIKPDVLRAFLTTSGGEKINLSDAH